MEEVRDAYWIVGKPLEKHPSAWKAENEVGRYYEAGTLKTRLMG
jgi:hypothetical protein